MKKIGILGGTFNPIHKGHIAMAEAVRKKLYLDRVLLIPSNLPPHKTKNKILPAKHRLSMVRLAVKEFKTLEASSVEVRRPGKSYTVDTLKALEKRHPRSTEFFLILGVDAFADFPAWRSPRGIIQRSNIVVVSRPGSRFADLRNSPYLKNQSKVPLDKIDKGKLKIFEVSLKPATRLIFLRVAARDVSATQIRDRRVQKRQLKNLLPASVESYIIKNNLYADAIFPVNSKRSKGTGHGRVKKESPSRGKGRSR